MSFWLGFFAGVIFLPILDTVLDKILPDPYQHLHDQLNARRVEVDALWAKVRGDKRLGVPGE